MNAPAEFHNKILYASFEFENITLLMNDVIHDKLSKNGIGNIGLSLEIPDATRARQIFDQLAEGGQVQFPFNKQFWGGLHGNLVDQFGIRWMINSRG
jgi:PhnB protein